MFNWFKGKGPRFGRPSFSGKLSDLEQIEELGGSLKQFRKAVNTRLNQAQTKGQIEVRLAQRKIEDTEHLVAMSGLDDALVTLYQKIEGWPERISQAHFSEHELLGLENVEATSEDLRLGRNLKVRFSYKGRNLEIRYAEEFQGELKLVADDEKVFAMILGKEGDAVFGKDITFLKPGDWMIDLIELQEVVKWSRRRKQSRSSAEAFVRRASDLPDLETLREFLSSSDKE